MKIKAPVTIKIVSQSYLLTSNLKGLGSVYFCCSLAYTYTNKTARHANDKTMIFSDYGVKYYLSDN